MRLAHIITTIVSTMLVSSAALAHSDILVSRSADGTSLVTGGYEFGGSPGGGNLVTPPPVRVFGYEFGENYADPFFAEDPGFVAVPDTFTPGTRFYFDVHDDVRYWNGTGPISFGAVPGGESLLISRGTPHITVGSGGTYPLAGLHIGDADGSTVGQQLHEHLDVCLLGPDGNSIPASSIYDINPPHDLLVEGDGSEAAPGVYLLKLTLRTTAPGIAPSDPVWIVYNVGMSEDVHDTAMDWVGSHLAPEPGCLVLLIVGGGMALLQRRHGA